MKQTFKFVIFHDEIRRVEDWHQVGERIPFAFCRRPTTPLLQANPNGVIQYDGIRMARTYRTVRAITIANVDLYSLPKGFSDTWSFLSKMLWERYIKARHNLHKLERDVEALKRTIEEMDHVVNQHDNRIEQLKWDCHGRNDADELIRLVRKRDATASIRSRKQGELEGMKRGLTVASIAARAMPLTFVKKEEM